MHLIVGWAKAWIRALRRRRGLILCLGLCLVLFLIWLHYLLPRHAIAELGRLTHTTISAERIVINYRGWVKLAGLTIRPRTSDAYENAILQAEEVQVVFSWPSLWHNRPFIESIRVDEFNCSILYDPHEKTWNTRGITLFKTDKLPAQLPHIYLKNGTLQYWRVAERKPQEILAVPFEVSLSPVSSSAQQLAIHIETGPIAQGFGGSRLQGTWQHGRVQLAGGISAFDLPGITRTWSIPDANLALTYDPDGHCDLRLKFLQAQAVHTPDTLALDWLNPVLGGTSGMFTRLQGFIDRYRPAGRINLDVAVHTDVKHLEKTEIQATVACQDVSIHDRQFPYRLEQLQGDVHISHQGLAGEGMQGRHGDARIHLDFHTQGFGGDWQYDVRMACERMPLDRDLYLALSERHRGMWDRLNPEGMVWIDNRRTRLSDTEDLRVLDVRLLGIQAAYEGFPYPLQNLTGEVRFEAQGATLTQVTAHREDSTITLKGTVDTPVDRPVVVDVHLEAQGVPFDDALTQALPREQRDAYRALNLHGKMDAQIHITNTEAPQAFPSYRANLCAENIRLRPPQWRSDLTDVDIEASLTPHALMLHSMTGQSGQSPLSIKGPIHFPSESETPSYCLAVESDAFQIEDLVAGLPDPSRRLVRSLHATGALGLTGRIESQLEQSEPNVDFLIDCQSNTARAQAWPYPLREINGTLRLRRHSLEIDQFSAIPDVNDCPAHARFQLSGVLGLNAGSCHQAHLSLAAQSIPLDNRLLETLPARWRSSLEPFGIQGSLNIAPSQLAMTELQGHPRIELKGGMSLHDCRMNLLGIPAEVNAVADIQLSHQRERGVQEGLISLALDPIRFYGKAVRRLETTLIYNPKQASWGTEQFTGEFYGGRLMGDFHMHWTPGADSSLQMRLGLSNANLYSFLKDNRPTEADMGEPSQGILAGSISLGLQRDEKSTCIGHCQLSIHDMKVGARSPLAKILGNLRGHAKDDIHFDRMFVNGYIQNEMIHFQRFDISGRSLALQGGGSLDAKANQIQLNLVTRGVRNATANPTVLQSLSEGLGGAVIRMHVEGDPMRPVVTTRTLPVFEDTLRILGATH